MATVGKPVSLISSTAFHTAPGEGALVLDSSLRPTCWNRDLVSILGYPEHLATRNAAHEAVHHFAANISAFYSSAGPMIAHKLSGRRRYQCRILVLSQGPQFILALLERCRTSTISLAVVAEKYKLTTREYQTLQCVVDGLSTKETAARLDISPNTVKVFLRMIMIKLDVSSRSAILSKLLHSPLAHGTLPTL